MRKWIGIILPGVAVVIAVNGMTIVAMALWLYVFPLSEEQFRIWRGISLGSSVFLAWKCQKNTKKLRKGKKRLP